MASIYSWESFIRIHGGEPGARDVFEKAMDELLRAENPGEEVHIVKASQGDGGIDVYVHHEDGIDIYQCKFFMGSMDSSRWSQIKNSFSKAMEPKGVKVLRWVLCMPREMQKEDIAKWDEFKKDRESKGVEIQLVDGNEIIQRMRDCDRKKGTNLIERYFRDPNGKAIPKCLTAIPGIDRNIGIIGRDEVMQNLRKMLDENGCIALISGLGGIGKTAVMRWICNTIKEDGNVKNHVAWITCGETLQDDIVLLRDAFGIPDSDDEEKAFNKIIERMKRFRGTLYLFMDNMYRNPDEEEMEILNSLYPNVHIMISSRHKIEDIHFVDLEVLEHDPAVEMFYRYYGRDQERLYKSIAGDIVDTVYRHTLLVELLAKAAGRSGGTLEDFNEKLKKEKFFNVFTCPIKTKHDKYRTIEESVIKLYEISGLTEEQQRIMKLFSIFTAEREIYYEVVHWAKLKENSMIELVDLAWLEQGGQENGYSIHQIIKDSISRQMMKSGDELKIEEYGELLEKAASTDSYLSVDFGFTKVRERLVLAEDVARSVNRRIKGMLEVGTRSKQYEPFLKIISDLFHNVAGVHFDQGNYARALEYYNNAREIREKILGRNHLSTATTYNGIAGTYQELGEYQNSLDYFMKALEIDKSLLGSNHIETATIYNNIACVYFKQAKYANSLNYYKKAIEIYERLLGSDHPDTTRMYNNIAGVYYEKGDYTKSLEYYEKTLAIRKRIMKNDNLDIAMTYSGMAGVYQNLNKYAKSLEYYEKVLEIRERILGSDHPDTAKTYNDIALVNHKQGNYSKALEYYKKALEIRERTIGSNHPDTAKTYNNIAGVYEDQREYTKALEYYEKALEVKEKTLGIDHLSTAKTYSNIARVYQYQGDYEKALAYYGKALEGMGSDHLSTVITYHNMAVMYQNQGDYKKALENYGKALEVSERVLGSDHSTTATIYNSIAGVYKAQGDYEKALEYCERALTVFKAKLGVNHRYTQSAQLAVQILKLRIKLD